jgi:hypothetical protein
MILSPVDRVEHDTFYKVDLNMATDAAAGSRGRTTVARTITCSARDIQEPGDVWEY